MPRIDPESPKQFGAEFWRRVHVVCCMWRGRYMHNLGPRRYAEQRVIDAGYCLDRHLTGEHYAKT